MKSTEGLSVTKQLLSELDLQELSSCSLLDSGGTSGLWTELLLPHQIQRWVVTGQAIVLLLSLLPR